MNMLTVQKFNYISKSQGDKRPSLDIHEIMIYYDILDFTGTTARKTIFPESWNIMESSKIPSKYHLSISFLAQKRTVFSISEKYFPVISKYPLSINFLAQKRPYFHLQKVQNKEFSVISKHGITCYRKYHLIVFLRTTERLSVLVLKISCKFRKYKGKIF